MKPACSVALSLATAIEVPMFSGQFTPQLDQMTDVNATAEVTS
jgi:hypothetical protein